MKKFNNLIFIVLALVLIIGGSYVLKNKDTTTNTTNTINDQEAINRYKAGDVSIVAKETNPFNPSQNIAIVASRKLVPTNPYNACGDEKIGIPCWVFVETSEKVDLLYRTFSEENRKGSYTPFVPVRAFGFPTISFIDKESFFIRGSWGGGIGGGLEFIEINSKTKEVKNSIAFSWNREDYHPRFAMNKNGRSFLFGDPACVYPSEAYPTQCENGIAIVETIINSQDGRDRKRVIKTWPGSMKKAVEEIIISSVTRPEDSLPLPHDFSIDIQKNLSNGNKIEFKIATKNYIYDLDTDKISEN